ncbi:MAG: FKBP-type peptidyl-prolyl cis-trans isomerase [Bacilli bacterium]|jgi:FKBP-type peptidyl-prolyl cis-trans isomerase FklB|nr:FKBP-type peptidyl-prolyl cis-trans isomerase [Bacilli bacterium]
MKRNSILIVTLLFAFLFSACDETETFDDQWKLDNEAQFTTISGNSQYVKINSQSGNGFIMVKKLVSGDGATPYFNSQVKVRYTGWYKKVWSKPDTYTDDKGNIIQNKKIFDSTQNNNIPRTFYVNGVVDGFSTALQHMKVGDKWEVWMPWNLGYGSAGYSAYELKPYTTLVFEIELIGIL